jgi:hypothetical protein
MPDSHRLFYTIRRSKNGKEALLLELLNQDLFKKHIEFDSRSHLVRELRGSIKPSVLNTITARLVYDNKVLYNDDHLLTWIDTKGNTKLKNLIKLSKSS